MSAAFQASALPADAIELGRVGEAWGIKGWVRIQPHSADTEALFATKDWYLQPPEPRFARGFSAFQGSVLSRVADIKVHADGVVARFEGMDDRNAAEALKGVRIHLPRSAFPATPEGEYYWVDLIGLQVVNREGVDLGQVRDLMSTGPQTVLVIEATPETEGAKPVERMIPFVSAFVDGVDLPGKRITVDWQPDY